MGTRRIHTTSSQGAKKHFNDVPASLKLVSMAEYVSDMGYYDGQHEVSDSFWPSAKVTSDIHQAVKSHKDSKKKPH